MRKEEFLARMDQALAALPYTERADILGDYVEHFRVGEEGGKTGEEIAAGLGSPEDLAASYLEGRTPPAIQPPAAFMPAPQPVSSPSYPYAGQYAGQYAQPPAQPAEPVYTYTSPTGPPEGSGSIQTSAQTLTTLLVVLLNIVVGIPVAAGLFVALLVLPLSAIGLAVGSVAAFIYGAPSAENPTLGAATVCMGVAMLALAVLLVTAFIALVRLLPSGIRRYIRFCSRLCRGGTAC